MDKLPLNNLDFGQPLSVEYECTPGVTPLCRECSGEGCQVCQPEDPYRCPNCEEAGGEPMELEDSDPGVGYYDILEVCTLCIGAKGERLP